MDRLTTDITERDYYTSEPIICGRNYKTNGNCTMEEVVDKLGELENLKDQIDCPLDVRLKVTHNTPIYDVEENEYIVEFVEKDIFSVYAIFYMSFRWNDYKKTWWLKKDKSE